MAAHGKVGWGLGRVRIVVAAGDEEEAHFQASQTTSRCGSCMGSALPLKQQEASSGARVPVRSSACRARCAQPPVYTQSHTAAPVPAPATSQPNTERGAPCQASSALPAAGREHAGPVRPAVRAAGGGRARRQTGARVQVGLQTFLVLAAFMQTVCRTRLACRLWCGQGSMASLSAVGPQSWLMKLGP